MGEIFQTIQKKNKQTNSDHFLKIIDNNTKHKVALGSQQHTEHPDIKHSNATYLNYHINGKLGQQLNVNGQICMVISMRLGSPLMHT